MKNNKTKLQTRLELTWWIITIIAVIAVLFPIYKTKTDYPFYWSNILFIVSTITLSRYIFLLKHTFLAKRQWLKVLVAVACIPLFLYLMKELNFFQKIAGNIGLEEMFSHLSLGGQTTMTTYVRTEMLFFGTASVITAGLMALRMIISFWRTHNRGTV